MATDPALPTAVLSHISSAGYRIPLVNSATGKTEYVEWSQLLAALAGVLTQQYFVALDPGTQDLSTLVAHEDFTNTFAVVVEHGATAATARPTAELVIWKGSVAPDNIAAGDIYSDTEP